MPGYWVVITTGGTQRFIFESNRRKLNVGASYLVAQLPVWVSAAVDEVSPGLQPTVNVSGVANLLVSDRGIGRRIIEQVTSTALDEAPGLQVWGSIHEITSDNYAGELRRAYDAHEQVRSALPPPTARFPGLPFTVRDAFVGLPVAGEVGVAGEVDNVGNDPDQPERLAVSAVVESQWTVSWDALRSVGARDADAGAEILKRAIWPVNKLEQSVGDVWTAVVHADGNGFGQLLMKLGGEHSDGPEYADRLQRFSKALDSVSYQALREAIKEVTTRCDTQKHWILPLVVGGDDLTAVVKVRYARSFVESYIRQFQHQTQDCDDINVLALEALGRGYLTVGAGIAIVKPTHPFHGAYTLAEELARSAKQDKNVSAYDVQVFHESVGRSLDDIRADLTYDNEGKLYPDPAVVSAPGGEPSPSKLDEVIGGYERANLSSSERHRLRTALTDLTRATNPGESWNTAKNALLARVAVIHPDNLRAATDLLTDDNRRYLIPALDLLDVEAPS